MTKTWELFVMPLVSLLFASSLQVVITKECNRTYEHEDFMPMVDKAMETTFTKSIQCDEISPSQGIYNSNKCNGYSFKC